MAVPERKDGRQGGDLRQLATERGLLNRADGSARWSQGPFIDLSLFFCLPIFLFFFIVQGGSILTLFNANAIYCDRLNLQCFT